MNEEEKQFRKEQIELLNAIVAKLVLIESGQSTLERSIFYGITKSTNKMLQKMRSEIIKTIRSQNDNAKTREPLLRRAYQRVREFVWKTLKKVGL